MIAPRHEDSQRTEQRKGLVEVQIVRGLSTPHPCAWDALRMFARIAVRGALESSIRLDPSAASRLSVSSSDTLTEKTS